MSKSILVIDTAENCNECVLHALTENDYDKEFYCVVNGKIVEEFACNRTKPDWCPLRDFPEKSNHPDYCDNGRYDKGWNDCIDEILKGANGNE